MKSEIKNNTELDIQLDDILTLNIYQMVILFLMSLQLTETVRYSLLQDINKFIFPGAKLSPSSFYNTLNRLEKLGFIEITNGGKSRVKSIKGTHKIRQALEIISKYTALLSFNPDLIFGEFLPIFETFIKIGQVNQVLFIDLDEFFDLGFTTLLKEHSKEFFIVADDESFEKYQNRSSEKIFQSQILNGKIREPDNIFDVVFIADFHLKNDFYGLDEKSLIKEALRVTKTNGQIIILATEELPKTNNLLLDSIAVNLRNNPFMVAIDKESFFDIINTTSPVKPKYYHENGFILAKINKV